MPETIGYIGLGNMGLPMARNLLRAGYPVVAYDIVGEKVDALAGEGALAAASPAEVARQAAIIFTSLPTTESLEEVVKGEDGILAGCSRGQIFIDTSTVPPPLSLHLSELLAERGVATLDAPVSGGSEGSEQGILSIMVGGSAAAFERCLPLFRVLGSEINHFGDNVGAGGYAKLANQIMVAMHLAGLAEAVAFAAKAGLDLNRLLPALGAGRAGSEVLKVNAAAVLARKFDPVGAMGPLRLLHKDLQSVVDTMGEMGVTGSMIRQILGMYQELVDQGKSEIDCMALLYPYEKIYGVEARG